uniref:Uncharacterized protein n=1 Tax=Glossina austeni TaxID=7395 RepID=A0A1A9UNR0_GLOAU
MFNDRETSFKSHVCKKLYERSRCNVACHDKIYTGRGCDAALYIKQCSGYNTAFKPSNDSANILVLGSLLHSGASDHMANDMWHVKKDEKFDLLLKLIFGKITKAL